MDDQEHGQSPEYEAPPLVAAGALDDEIGPGKSAPLRSARLDPWLIGAGIALQLLVLVGIMFAKTAPFVGAKTVLLRVAPVDPRDMMRGDYVILSYDIGRNVPLPAGLSRDGGETIYTRLVPDEDGRHYVSGGSDLSPPASGLFIQGTIQDWNRVEYGIESYYVQEGTGHDYEQAVRERRLSAEVALDGQGHAQLLRLVIE